MTLSHKTVSVSILIMMVGMFGCAYALDKTNYIRNGCAEVQLNIENSAYIPDSLEASILTLSLFDRPLESSTVKMNRTGNIFYLSVPLCTNEAIVGIIVESPEQRYAVGMIELNQDSPLIINGGFSPDGTLILSKSNDTGVNQYDLGLTPENKSNVLSDIIYRFVCYRIGIDGKKPSIKPEDYSDWRVVESKLDSLYYLQLDYALDGRTIPDGVGDWLINNLKYFYAGNWRFNYVDRAKRTFNVQGEVIAPPLEYYTFLNDIDFTSIMNHSTVFGPYYLLNKMLTQLPIDIKPIGDIPIDIWQNVLKEKIAPIIPAPEPLMMDLLAATSYVQQIAEDNRLLNDVQIANIADGFKNSDLGDIILNINNSLMSDLKQSTSMVDHTGQQFSLDDFLSKYPDIPVIVDLWNTWCSPCMNAHNEIKTFVHPDGILCLYICDESSSHDEWERIAPRIGGLHIRVSSKDMESILAQFELAAFPSYLFFNNRHELVNKQTGFSHNQYADAVNQLMLR